MASGTVFSTLLVLLSKSGQDLESLWNAAGPVNDPTGNKHALDLQLVIRDGNFRSELIDNWINRSFDTLILYGMNKAGDIFWETEFSASGTVSNLASWLVGTNIVGTSAEINDFQDTIFSDQNYRLRITPPDDAHTSWFAVSYNDLSYGPLPLIFVPRFPYKPFSNPVFLDGVLGCWHLSVLANLTFMFEVDGSGITPDICIRHCWDNYTVAMLSENRRCHCADVDDNSPPSEDLSNCYLYCSDAIHLCGGFDGSVGNSYHVQGSKLPGFLETILLYEAIYPQVNSTVRVDASDINRVNSSNFVFITEVAVNISGALNYTVRYSEQACAEAEANLKDLFLTTDHSPEFTNVVARWPGSTHDNVIFENSGLKQWLDRGNHGWLIGDSGYALKRYMLTPKVFQANGNIGAVDILKVRCLEIVLNYTASAVSVQLWGPKETSEFVEVPVLVIRGKTRTEASSTSTTSSSSSTSNSTSISLPSSTPSTTAGETSSASSATNPLISDQTESELPCLCPSENARVNLTEQELQEKILELQRNLSVNVSQLSSTIRKLISAGDSRVTAVSIGYVGIGILAGIFSAIVLIDSATLLKDLKNLIHNIKTGLFGAHD